MSIDAPFDTPEVAETFARYPPHARAKLLALRRLILDTAERTEGVGAVVESLKWGEPAYRSRSGRMGSTVRIDWKPAKPGQYAMYFHCKTTLVETFRTLFPGEFGFEGNRAIVFDMDADLPEDAVRVCIEAALTYRADRRRSQDPAKRI
ncbi:MAG: DUF1801 domain-containing protein [Lysobacter sp.]|nr:DUF1801 domain-containing protein [Lysobacter sp.]